MPTRTGANSASITLAAKIEACRKFENRSPSRGSYLFKNSPRNQTSSLKPFARANTSRYGVRGRKQPGVHSANFMGTEADNRGETVKTNNPTIKSNITFHLWGKI